MKGFVPAEGIGPVFLLGEAPGADEAVEGHPFVGKSGAFLFSSLKRVGIERDQFTIGNVISCRPPNNELVGAPYETEAISCCSSILDANIASYKAGRANPIILAVGVTAFKTAMSLKKGDHLLKKDYYGYIHWSERFKCWVVAVPHPAFILRGQFSSLPILLFGAQRAISISTEGFSYDEPNLILDPSPEVFSAWVDSYTEALRLNPTTTFLSVDIETPRKAKGDEAKLFREDAEDYIIQRCSFCYKTTEAVSVLWTAPYIPAIERLLALKENQIVGWNLAYDLPRIKHQMPIVGKVCDGMLWWHVLNSALEKGLGFVTPYYWQRARMWKHLSGDEPARYNALDALAALINILGIVEDLKGTGQWNVIDRHVIQLGQVLDYMSGKGVLLDQAARSEAETLFTARLLDAETAMLSEIPPEARRLKVFKKKPKKMEGIKVRRSLKLVKTCPNCGLVNPKKPHFKVFKRKLNECGGLSPALVETEVDEFYSELEWKASQVQLLSYQKVKGQKAIINRQTGTATFDDTAIESLKKKYPLDRLYPLIGDQRQYSKLIGTYLGVTKDGKVIGGLQVGKDGRIHPEYTINPSTLRLACQNPNMQNLPRVGKDDDPESVIRNLIIAPEGCLLGEADFAAIEAVLSAYFARWKDGIRLAKLGIHSYLASHVLGRPADLSWSDEDLATYFKEIKKSSDPEVIRVYNACKRVIHGSNYGMTPGKMVLSEPETFPTLQHAKRMQDTYFDVASPIRKWQLQTQLEAHKTGELRNPWNYRHSFNSVFVNKKENGQWVRKPGEDANAALAFLPQSSAAAILKDVMLRLFFERFDESGQYLRLQVHDSLVSEAPKDLLDRALSVKIEEMTKPIPELPLPASYGMGPSLVIGVDVKIGERWGSLR